MGGRDPTPLAITSVSHGCFSRNMELQVELSIKPSYSEVSHEHLIGYCSYFLAKCPLPSFSKMLLVGIEYLGRCSFLFDIKDCNLSNLCHWTDIPFSFLKGLIMKCHFNIQAVPGTQDVIWSLLMFCMGSQMARFFVTSYKCIRLPVPS